MTRFHASAFSLALLLTGAGMLNAQPVLSQVEDNPLDRTKQSNQTRCLLTSDDCPLDVTADVTPGVESPVPTVITAEGIPDITEIELPISDAQLLSQESPDEADRPAAEEEAAPTDTVDEEVELEITVTGTRTPRAVQLSPANVTVIKAEELQRQLGQDIRDLIRYEPGISVNEDETYGATDYNIRGLERNRILLQVDGIRLPTFFEFGSSILGRDFVDVGSVQTTEIIRGPASALYGSDALGGVVSYLTPDPSDLLALTDRDYYISGSTQFRSSNSGFSGTGTVAFRATDNLSGLVRFTHRENTERDNNAEDRFEDPFFGVTNNVLGKLEFKINDYNTVLLTGEYFNEAGDFDTAVDNLNLPLAFPGITILSDDTDTETTRSRFSIAYKFDNPESESFLQFGRVQFYYQESDYQETRTRNDIFANPFVPPPFTPPPARRFRELNNLFVEDIIGGDIQLRSDFRTGSVAHKLTYGLDISSTFNQRIRDGQRINLDTGAVSNRVGPDAFPIKDFPDSDTLRIGVYLQDEIEFGEGRFTVIPGLRFDYYSLATQPDALFFNNPGAEATDLNDSALSPSLGLVYKVTPEIALVGRYARGFRGPNYIEINSGFSNPESGYRTISNPNLEPETSHTFELGVKGAFSRGTFGVTGFYSIYDNFIFGAAEGSTAGTEPAGCFPPFTPGCVQVFQSQNLEQVRIYGIEAQGEYRFSSEPHGFRILGGLAWIIGDDDQNNQPLETVNPFEAVVGLGYRAPEDQWGAELIGTFVGTARVDSEPDDFIPGGFAVVDLTGFVKVTPNLSLRGGIYNIFDAEYVRYADARRLNNETNNTTTDPTFAQRRARITQPGINFGVGLTFEF